MVILTLESHFYENTAILDYLKEINFIGPFPGGVEVLLVSMETAIAEVRYKFDKVDLTSTKLRSILKKGNILVFSNLDEYSKYKGLSPKKSKRFRY